MSTENGVEIEKKPDVSQTGKSSMEILSELFSTFDAEPPVIVKKEKKEESLKKHKKAKKKHKKEKKHKKKSKKHKRSRSGSSSSSSSGSQIDLAQILIKKEKNVSDKIKIEGTNLTLSLGDIGLKNEKKIDKKESVNDFDIEPKDEKYDPMDNFSPERNSNNKRNDDSSKGNKIVIKDLKNSTVLSQIKKESGHKSRKDGENDKKSNKSHKKHKHKRSISDEKSKTKEKKLKSSHDYDNSRDNHHVHHDHRSKDDKRSLDKDRHRRSDQDFYREKRHRSRDRTERSRDRESRSRNKHKEDPYNKELEEYKKLKKDNSFYSDKPRERDRDRDRERERERERSSEKWFMRDRYRGHDDRDRRFRSRRSRSKSRENSSGIDKKKLLEIARRNAINMMKSGSLPGALTLGPQAQEKVIAAIKSGGKTIEELTDFCKTLSKKEELGELSSLSEREESESEEPFHHPFQIKEKATSITMNIKNSVQLPTKSTTERTTELRMQFPVSSGQQHRKTESEWVPVSPSEPKKATQPKAITAPPKKDTILAIEAPPEKPAPEVPAIVPPVVQGPQIIPVTTASSASVDIGSIVSQRLAAMRKLQDNPHDVQALSQMYKSNKEMNSWAETNKNLGQFTGSTGAQLLTPAQLASGFQAWAKKDQLQTAAPVSGGMGMHLLQKMGWKPGEGLGKEKTGALEPLLLEVKLDKKGLVATEEAPQKNKKKVKGQPTVKTLQGKHPVSLLGEYASKRKLGAPQYILEFECGPDHKKNFLFKVVLDGLEFKPNVASNNKKEAKANAATLALQNIGLLPS